MVGIKDTLKLIAVMILTFCSVFMCAVFINYMFDLHKMQNLIEKNQLQEIFDAQIIKGKTITASAGGMLGIVTLIVLIYSIGRFINENSANLGIMKALGYSEWQCAFSFIKFGIAVLISSCFAYLTAYLLSPLFYDPIANIKVSFGFHIKTVFLVVIMPTVLLSLISVLYARFRLRKKPLDLINNVKKIKVNKLTLLLQNKDKNNSFLKGLKGSILSNSLSLVFFVGFASLAFSTQIQMAITIREYATNNTATITLISLGLILGLTTLLIALSFIVESNKKYIALLKAYGYTQNECSNSLLSGYRIVGYIGFIIGTIYKYVLLSILIDSFVEPNITAVIKFDFVGFFITLGAFIFFYEIIILLFKSKINKISLRQIMYS